MVKRLSPIVLALLLYLLWTAATYLLEGRLQTLRRPEAIIDRVVYALVANIAIGTVGAMGLLRHLADRKATTREGSGFVSLSLNVLMVLLGLLFGLSFYARRHPPTFDPVILANAFAQVLVTSIAEVLVCWSVVGSVVRGVTKGWGAVPSYLAAAMTVSILFGTYHIAHSPPFNTVSMILVLSAVGLLTSAFFFLTRSIYGTIVYHNCLGLYGVVGALAGAGRLQTFRAPMPPLYAMALLATAALVLTDAFLLRRPTRGA